MTRLEELIQELCPDGVEFKKFGEIATISRGGSFQKKDFTDTGVPCIHYGQIYTKYGLFVDETISFIDPAISMKQKYAVKNDIVMAVTSENIEDVCKCVAYFGDEPAAVSGHTAIIHHNQDAKYLVYYLHSSMFFAQKEKLAHGTKVIEVTPDKLNAVEVPVPPLEVQHEIVRILDRVTLLRQELLNQLSAELSARRKQYEYYRNKLLPFSQEDVEWKTLGEICTIVRGASPRPIKNYVTDDAEGVNWIKIGDVKPGDKYITSCAEKITKEGAKKSRVVKPGDFILSNSMSFGRPYILNIEGCIHDGWLSIRDFDEYVTPDYLYHILVSSYIQAVMAQRASFGGAVQNLNADIVRGIEIPIVSKEEQSKIVKILDNFSVLCTNISSGLPSEIEARTKQYEYYRDKLLSFKRKELL